jgi:hypothetical protein
MMNDKYRLFNLITHVTQGASVPPISYVAIRRKPLSGLIYFLTDAILNTNPDRG